MIALVNSVLMASVNVCSMTTWTFIGTCVTCSALQLISHPLRKEIYSSPGILYAFIHGLFWVVIHCHCTLIFSCLDSNCSSPDKCFFDRTGTIFHCPKGKLSSQQDYVTYEEWVTEDVNSHSYMDPLQYGEEGKVFHGVPPTRRIKSIWKKRTRTRLEFVQRLFELTPNAFEHHQLEMVQREQLRLHIDSITKTNGLIVFWMDYPENANIIDRQEQQSDYYDR